ncbi:MAG: hemerythrin family protein [Treponema sp.]|nr:hemerythrin family protein [Treponema sp.]
MVQPSDKTTNYIVWDKKFELGIPMIDAQHKKIVDMCNELYQVLAHTNREDEKAWQNAMRKTLQEAAKYVNEHFRSEEGLLKAACYKNFDGHKCKHTEFIKEILNKIENFNTLTYNDAFKFVKFLYDWLLTHIAYVDKDYVPTVKAYALKREQENGAYHS